MIRSYEFLNKRECTANFHIALRSSSKVFCPFATSPRSYGSPPPPLPFLHSTEYANDDNGTYVYKIYVPAHGKFFDTTVE